MTQPRMKFPVCLCVHYFSHLLFCCCRFLFSCYVSLSLSRPSLPNVVATLCRHVIIIIYFERDAWNLVLDSCFFFLISSISIAIDRSSGFGLFYNKSKCLIGLSASIKWLFDWCQPRECSRLDSLFISPSWKNKKANGKPPLLPAVVELAERCPPIDFEKIRVKDKKGKSFHLDWRQPHSSFNLS